MEFTSKQLNEMEINFKNATFNDMVTSKIYCKFIIYLYKKIGNPLTLTDIQIALYLLPKLSCVQYTKISQKIIAKKLDKHPQNINRTFKKLRAQHLLLQNSNNPKEYKLNAALLFSIHDHAEKRNTYYKYHKILRISKFQLVIIEKKE